MDTGKYCCCFCNTTIEGSVTALLVATNWQEEDENKQQTQQLFCHLECLGKSLHALSYLYVDEEIYED